MPSNKQRREAAQRHLQRQMERRTEQAQRRKRTTAAVAVAVAALVVTGVVLLGTGVLGGGDAGDEAGSASESTTAPAGDTPAAEPTTAAAPVTNADGTVTCDYAPAQGGEVIETGTPPEAGAVEAEGTVELAVRTDQGDLTLTLDRAVAPCAVESFTFLAEQDYFDDTPCHRLTTSPSLSVLQCGDPTGTGTGGPSYRFAEEVTPETTYERGTVAMAKSAAPSSTGSQFFLVYGDSQLPPQYTVVGSVDEAGLEVLDAIAEAGVEGGGEDGAPAEDVTIEELQAAA